MARHLKVGSSAAIWISDIQFEFQLVKKCSVRDQTEASVHVTYAAKPTRGERASIR